MLRQRSIGIVLTVILSSPSWAITDAPSASNEIDSQGREYLAGDSQRMGNQGAIQAMQTGTILTGQAIPMLMSIIPSVRAAGAALMAKAALEFAQAGANEGTSRANGDQKQLLTRSEGDRGYQATAGMEKIVTPELESLLKQNGMTTSQFLDDLATGKLSSPQAVLDKFGGGKDITADDMQAADAIADDKVKNEVFGGTNGDAALEAIGYNSEGERVSAEGSRGVASVGQVTIDSPPSPLVNSNPEAAVQNAAAASTSIAEKAENPNEVDSDPSSVVKALESLLGGAHANALQGESSARQVGFLLAKLGSLGISPPRESIFQTANRFYRRQRLR